MQRYELLGRNGAGANSTVYRCRNRVSGHVAAVKKLEGATVQQALHEAAVMLVCAHENCVTLLEVQQGISTGAVFLVMENVEHSLPRELLLNPRGLPLCKAKLIAFQLAQALEHVHNMKFIHGDIKPANILLAAQNNVKLCDFGSASRATNASYEAYDRVVIASSCTQIGMDSSYAIGNTASAAAGIVRPTAAASRWYCAPESLLGAAGSPASDIWALGCVLGELMTGRPLMPGGEGQLNQLSVVVSMLGALSPEQERLLQLLPADQRAAVEAARARGPQLDKIPRLASCPALLEVVRACLHPDPAARPTARELQNMQFFEDLRAAQQASRQAAVDARASGGSSPMQLSRRSSSGNMGMDMKEGLLDTGGAAGVASVVDNTMQAWPAAPADASKDGGISKVPSAVAQEAAPQPPRRLGGVQAAPPLRPAARARVSALTATIRNNPFDEDTCCTDLMTQVLGLIADWEEERRMETLGPIALSARLSNSSNSPGSKTPSLGGSSGGEGGATTVAISPVGALAAARQGPTEMPLTPVSRVPEAASYSPIPSSTATGDTSPFWPTPAAFVTVASRTISSMDCLPCVPATTAPSSTAIGATPVSRVAVRANIPLSVSVGALTCLVKAATLTPYAPTATATAAAVSKPSPALLRSQAILNRARRHYSRDTRFGPDCTSMFATSCPRSGLGIGVTLLQQDLATAADVNSMNAVRLEMPSARGSRRSFADLTVLDSVSEQGTEHPTFSCGTPPEGKRRRATGLMAVSSQTSLVRQGSLPMDPSLGSLRESAPYSGRASPLLAPGSRRMRRSNSINGMAAGSPVWPAGWQGMPLGGASAMGAVVARAVNIPQPGTGRNMHLGL